MADAADPPLDDEARQLILAQKKAEARKAIAAAVATSIPEIGKLGDTLDAGDSGGSSLAIVEAGRASKAGAASIVDAVLAEALDGTIVIVEDRAFLQDDIALEEIEARLAAFESGFATIRARLAPAVPPPTHGKTFAPAIVAGAVLPTVLGLAGAASSLVGLFRSDYAVSSRTVTADRLGLIAEVARGLREKGRTVLLPGLALASGSALLTKVRQDVETRFNLELELSEFENRATTPGTHQTEIMRTRLGKLYEASDTYGGKGDAAGQANVDAIINRVAGDLLAKETDPQAAADRALVAAGRNLIAAFDAFLTAVSAAPASGPSPLAAATMRRLIKDRTAGHPVYLLFVEVSSAGADVVTRTSNIRFGGQAAVLGGVGVTYLLADAAGDLVGSGTFHRVSSSVFDFASLTRVDSHDWEK